MVCCFVLLGFSVVGVGVLSCVVGLGDGCLVFARGLRVVMVWFGFVWCVFMVWCLVVI